MAKRTPWTEAAISSRAARSCSIWIDSALRRVARSPMTRLRASCTCSSRALPSSLALAITASPAATASARIPSTSWRAS